VLFIFSTARLVPVTADAHAFGTKLILPVIMSQRNFNESFYNSVYLRQEQNKFGFF